MQNVTVSKAKLDWGMWLMWIFGLITGAILF